MTANNEAAAISPVEALRPFLRHTNRCAYDRFMAKDNRCTCGLKDAVAALNTTRSPVLSDEQVEVVARAIMRHFDADPDVFIGMYGSRGHFDDCARAVIEALSRSPVQEPGDG